VIKRKLVLRQRFGAPLLLGLAPLLASCTGGEHSVVELTRARAAIDATEFEGTVLLLDAQSGALQAGHAERVDFGLIPASTFKILNSLIALELGVVAGANTVLPWDSVERGRPEINRDLDLQSAFRLSAVPHFQELARRIGPERMQSFVDAIGYGNGDISGGIDEFWLTGGLRISPREQVYFLHRLYRDDLPFSPAVLAAVKEMMVSEETPDHRIRAKTGWAVLPGDHNVGWWVGWVEHSAQVTIFATALEATAPDEGFGPARLAVTRRVLMDAGVLDFN